MRVPFLNVHSPRAVTQEGARYAERESAADDIVLAAGTQLCLNKDNDDTRLWNRTAEK